MDILGRTTRGNRGLPKLLFIFTITYKTILTKISEWLRLCGV